MRAQNSFEIFQLKFDTLNKGLLETYPALCLKFETCAFLQTRFLQCGKYRGCPDLVCSVGWTPSFFNLLQLKNVSNANTGIKWKKAVQNYNKDTRKTSMKVLWDYYC